MRRKAFFLGVLLTAAPALFAVSRYANAFLEIGVGARALAMGSAACGLTDDAMSFYWNPAGLAYIKRAQLSGMVGNQFGSLSEPLGNYHHIGLTLPMSDKVVIAANWIRLAVDGIPIFDELQGHSYYDRLHNLSLRPSGDAEGMFADVEDAFLFSFSRQNELNWDLGWMFHRVRVDMPIGINLKFMRQSMGSGTASGIGMDVGAMLKLHMDDLFQAGKLGIISLGMQLQDFTRTSMNWNTKHQDFIPLNVKWGLAYTQPLPIEGHFFSIALDWDSRWNGGRHVGVEYSGFGVFFLRAGFDNSRFSVGAGLRFWVVGIDYAFLSHELDALHRIGCVISF